MHTDLSEHLHTEECNVFIREFKECHATHSFRRFLGYCDNYNQQMRKCLKAERLRRRDANHADSKKRLAEIRARILAQEATNRTNIQ